jgi:hypothetical protein
MELKERKRSGFCASKGCKVHSVAVADGKTFFSAHSGMLELCEEHLTEALDMAQERGRTLEWKEKEAPGENAGEETQAQPAQETAKALDVDATLAQAVPVPEVVKEVAAPAVVAPPIQDLTVLPPQAKGVEEEMRQETAAAEEVYLGIQEMEIETKEDMDFAAEILGEAKTKRKRIDEKRKEITAPLNTALKAVNELFRPAMDFYDQCERLIKAKISAARMQAEEAARRALVAAGEAVAEGSAEGVAQALAVHDAAVQFPVADGIQYRSRWKFEIVDESQIPREYLMPNLALIQGAVTHKKGATDIPGIRVFEDKVIAKV